MSGEWHRICRVEEVEDGQPVARVVDGADRGDQRICVVKGHGDEFVAMLDRCPHRDIALSGGLVRDGMLTCPGHFWRFDLTTGQRSDLPEVQLTRYATRVRNGWVEASVPRPAPRRSMRDWLLAQARGDD